MAYSASALYFGGAREKSTGYGPVIGYANKDTLVVTEAYYYDVPVDNVNNRWTVEKLYAPTSIYGGKSTINHLMIGLGSPRDTSLALASDNKFMLILGRDHSAAAAWTTVGCWKWSVYYVKTESTMYYVIDDINGPIEEGVNPNNKLALYIWARSWTN